MKDVFQSFFRDDDGAVTVDFVVITAAICMLGLVVVLSITEGALSLANEIKMFLENIDG